MHRIVACNLCKPNFLRCLLKITRFRYDFPLHTYLKLLNVFIFALIVDPLKPNENFLYDVQKVSLVVHHLDGNHFPTFYFSYIPQTYRETLFYEWNYISEATAFLDFHKET